MTCGDNNVLLTLILWFAGFVRLAWSTLLSCYPPHSFPYLFGLQGHSPSQALPLHYMIEKFDCVKYFK